MKRVFVLLLAAVPVWSVAWDESCAPAEGQMPEIGSHKNPRLGMMRRGLLLLGVLCLMCGLAFAQEESEDYDPFGDCANYYYGIGVPQSFQKAFECFQKADDDIWLILMTLNAEGTPQSLKEARELLTRAQQKPKCCDSGLLNLAAYFVERCEKDAASLKTKLTICDFAGGTNDTEVCRADFEFTMRDKYNAELKAIEAKLGAPAKATLEGITALFDEFKKADGSWMYDEMVEGTGRGTFGIDQEILDQSNFASLIRIIVKNHGLKPRSEEELQAKDKELNSAYRDRIKTATADWDYQLKDPASKDDWPNIRKNREQYLDSAKQAERLWIKLQEPWKKLAEELYRGEMPPEAIDRAIETELREVRIQEIQCEDQCDKDFFSAPLFY